MALTKITGEGTGSLDSLTTTGALDVTTSTHANASVFKSTGNTQLFLQDTDASSDDQFWGFQVSGGSLNILTCDDDRSGGFFTPIEITQAGAFNHSVSASGDIAKFVTSANSGTGLFLNSQTANQIDVVGFDGSAANAVNIRSGGASGSGMLIDTSNNIMMGTTSVGGTSILSLGSSNYMVATHNDGGTSGFFGQIRFRNNANSADVGTINRVNDASVQYNTTSDARLKENIADMTGAITRVKQLAPKRYSWVNEDLDAADQDGFLAHEAQAVVPVAVSGTQNEVDEDGNPVYMQMDYSKLVPLLTGALKEAITKIETLETEITALKARVTALEDAD